MPHSPTSAADQAVTSETAPVIVALLDAGPVPDIVPGLAGDRPVLAVASLDQALAAAPDAPVLVMIDAPEQQLLGLLQDDDTAVAGLSRWVAQAEALLAVIRPARRRLTLLDRSVLASDPRACAEIVAARMGLAADAMPPEGPPADTPAPGPQAVMAALLLNSDPHAQALADEIRAMMWRPTAAQPIGTDDIGRAFEALRDCREQDSAATATCELLQQDLLQMQDQLEQQAIESDLRRSAAEAAEQRVQLQGATAAARESVLGAVLLDQGRQADARRADIAGLRAEIEEISAARAAAEKAAQATREEAAAQKTALEEVLSELESVYASNSWKITGPIRAARRLLGRS